MKGYRGDIEKLTKANNQFRHVLYTAKQSQLVLMCLQPGEEIGEEVHEGNDQFFRFEEGTGECVIDGNVYEIGDGVAVIVPMGARHNIKNTGSIPLRLYTLYCPPHHKDGITRATKEQAESEDAPFEGATTE